MSAIAAHTANAADRIGARRALPSITVRLSPEEKARFSALAAASALSESAVALNAIRILLNSDATSAGIAAPAPGRVAATDRITVRLRPGDGATIARRATQRGMKPATYLAILVRTHIAANPPLAVEELAALKQTVTILAALGRVLAQATRMSSVGITREELQRTRATVEALEQRVVEFAQAALMSWESRNA